MIEGDGFEPRFGRLGEQVAPSHRASREAGPVAEERDEHQPLEAREPGDDLPHDVRAVVVAARVPIAVDGEEHLRFDLAEPVDDGAGPEVGRARGPDRAEARRGEERDHRLGTVGEERRHPVSDPDAEMPQARGRRADALRELGPSEVERRPVLAPREDRRALVRLGERVLGVVQACSLEPSGTRHAAVGEDGVERRVGAHAGELPQRGPEPLQVRDRPAPQVLVGVEREAALAFEPAQEPREVRVTNQLVRWPPEQFALFHHARP
jgi:hypothetical protein